MKFSIKQKQSRLRKLISSNDEDVAKLKPLMPYVNQADTLINKILERKQMMDDLANSILAQKRSEDAFAIYCNTGKFPE